MPCDSRENFRDSMGETSPRRPQWAMIQASSQTSNLFETIAMAKKSAKTVSATEQKSVRPAPVPNNAADAEPAHRWTFLTNHAHVLIVLSDEPDIVLREVAVRVGITERAVQRIVQDLEEGGFIEKQRVGRKNQYNIIPNVALRHPIEAHRTIGDILDLIAGD